MHDACVFLQVGTFKPEDAVLLGALSLTVDYFDQFVLALRSHFAHRREQLNVIVKRT